MDSGKWVQFGPSGRAFRLLASVEDKAEERNPGHDGVYVDIIYQEDDDNTAYFLRVVNNSDEGPSWEKFYELGDTGLVECENLYGIEENAEDDLEDE